jgi:CheY-like chemotaxis protein
MRAFIVEDEMMVAMLLEDMLGELGFEIGSRAVHFEEAIQIAATGQFDLAVLDVNVNGKNTYPVAGILQERGIPFVFATGYGANALGGRFAGVPILHKPFSDRELMEAVERAMAQPTTKPVPLPDASDAPL